MKIMWCWRCKAKVPMLGEEEFRVIEELYRQGFSFTKEFRQKHNLLLEILQLKKDFVQYVINIRN